MMTSRALKHTERAKRISADGRRKIEAKLTLKVTKAVETAQGFTADTVENRVLEIELKAQS